MKRLIVFALGMLLATNAWAADFVWLEGENPTSSNVEAKGQSWANAEYLSGGQWMIVSMPADQLAKLPAEGVMLSYDFEAPSAGHYRLWDRIGYEGVRSPFDWRLDGGQWQTVKPSDYTTDLMDLSEWTEVAWFKLGEADLAAGKHKLEIHPTPTMKEENGKQTPDRIMYATDALCIYKGEFRPNGKYKPGEDWQSEQDKQAAAHVFQVPAEGAGAPDRVSVSLAGIWQVCRYDEPGEIVDRDVPTTTLPDRDQAFWTSIPVPGDKFKDRPDLDFAHRIVYRTRVNVPKEMAGRSFYLRFPSINMIASAFVNGQYCGGTKAMYALWECDVTKALVPGQDNEVCVVIKDVYYAASPKKSNGQSCRKSFNIPVGWIGRNYVSQVYDFPVGSDYGAHAGILEEPSLVVAGGVYSTDVFAMPSVKDKKLTLQVSVLNPTAGERTVQVVNEVVPASGGAAEKVFKPVDATIPAGKEAVLAIFEPWENPKLWWPDDPKMYDVVTKIMEGDKVVDVRHTHFGFREWSWDGPQFKLNGVPWLLHADTSYGDLGGDPEKAVAFWRKNGDNMWRFWGRSFSGLHAQEVLDFMDTHGVVVRRSGIFDGEGANYLSGLSNNKELFDNWITQLQAQVREERNHPSILIWSVENEITFINARNLGQSKAVEPEIERGAKAVMAEDPTRPTMVDGGNCLLDNSMPVNGVHYPETYWRDYPDEAYTMEKELATPQKDVPWPSPWQLQTDRPIFMGESYFLRGNKPADFAQFGGEGCFSGWSDYARRGAGLLAKMLAEGYRWHGVAAYHFWLNSSDDDGLQFNSWQPVCVLCRQWNWTLGGGSNVSRTLKVFNDTHYDTPITAAWELTLGGKHAAGESKEFKLAPGANQEYEISVAVPKVKERTAGEFVLTCQRDGNEVFREVKQVAVIDPDGGPKPALKKEELAVMDPAGAVKARLDARGIAYTAAAAFEDIPATARVVVVGPDALSAREATDNKWLSLAARGTRVLVLDQQEPLHYMAVPADLTPTNFVGRVAFAENIQHPIFAGLDQQDFFTWSKDHVVYRNVYRKATRGAVSLAHCDEQLGYSAIAECPVNDGLMLLCQMVVGQKLATDPVAERLFDNMLAYCAVYKPVRKATAVAMDPATPAGKLLADSALQFDKAPGVVEAVTDGKHQVLVFDATPANLKALADSAAKVKAYTDAGGWLLAWGLTPDGLADFNRLVGVDHVLRPFELERVTLPAQRDPLLSGLTSRDVAMESGVQIFGWQGDKYMVDDEFTYIVDLEDIAPFCELPGAKAGTKVDPQADPAGRSRNIVNGFTSADAWKLIYYMSADSPRIKMTLPRPETITDLGIVLNQHYCKAGKVNLYYDADPKPVSVKTEISTERQDFALEPRKASALTIELADFDKPGKTTGIDNVWLTVARTPEWHAKVKPLLNIGGLVKYPMGQGGLVLCQLNVPEREAQPENAQKKRNIVSSLLRNMGAQFSGAKILVPGEGLNYAPVALDEHCNQYLTKDKGWFDNAHDLAHLPIGANTFAGVRYLIRDFKTSPLPSCVMLKGQGVKGDMPASVTGLPVSGKADSLFFLHAFKRTQGWQAPREGDKTPPALFKYVVHYADGTTVDVPVRYGEGADNWIQKDPQGLKGAVVAWAAAFPDDTSGQQAVLYQMQWDNPKPDVAISGVDLTYDEATKGQYGVPALMAITAATRIK